MDSLNLQNSISQKPWPPDGITWYYSDDKAGIYIALGDCRDILPELEPVDLVLTDLVLTTPISM